MKKELNTFVKENEVPSLLNSCESIESETTSSSINCNSVCQNQGKTCINADVGVYNTQINTWVFDTGATCSLSYGSSKNEPVEGGLKLQCLCC
jgi:hypothetical protein